MFPVKVLGAEADTPLAMVSIRKDIEMSERLNRENGIHSASLILAGLCAAILDQVNRYSLTVDIAPELRARLDGALAEISSGMTETAATRAAEAVRVALDACAARDREIAHRTAVETQHVVGVLNHALTVLAGGSERTVARLHRVQASLQRTSQVRDAEGLRTSLAAAMNLIREEAAHEQEHSERELAGFEAQVIRVREHLAANPSRRHPGRREAIEALTERISAPRPSGATSLFVAAFSIDQIRALMQRYGHEPVDELFFQLIRERVQPLAEQFECWRWSQGCIIALFEYKPDLIALQAKLAELGRGPLVYRMTLGSRTAVMKIAVSHLAIALPVCAEQAAGKTAFEGLAEQLDRFGGFEEPGRTSTQLAPSQKAESKHGRVRDGGPVAAT